MEVGTSSCQSGDERRKTAGKAGLDGSSSLGWQVGRQRRRYSGGGSGGGSGSGRVVEWFRVVRVFEVVVVVSCEFGDCC